MNLIVPRKISRFRPIREWQFPGELAYYLTHQILIRMQHAELVTLLGQNEAFETAPATALDTLVAAAEVCTLEDSTPLIQQGKTGESIWMLLAGELDVLVDGDRVNHITGKGEVVGEISAVSQTPATATVLCKGPVQALRIPQTALHEVMKTSPQLAGSMLRSMAKYLGRR